MISQGDQAPALDVLTSDGEFHTARRQFARWAESGDVTVEQVASEPFDSFGDLRSAMIEDHPELGIDGVIDLKWAPPKLDAKADGPVSYPIKDFYLTNAICRASPTMHRCSEELVHGVAYQEAAE